LQAIRAASSHHQLATLTLHDPTDAAGERDLVDRARHGDREAFGVLVRAHLPGAIRAATRIVRNVEDAEDVVQDAFLSALRNIDDFDAERRFWPWLSRIVVNRALDVVSARRVRSTDELSFDVPDSGPSPQAVALESDLVERVRRVTATMPPRQRLVVEMFDLDGASVNDIAELTGSSPATVRWHLHMGRRVLRAALSNLYGGNK
jgi:RNA polymerase sigma-70 factor (ECF subfamily)